MQINSWGSAAVPISLALLFAGLLAGCDLAAPEPDVVKTPEQMWAEQRKALPPVPDSLKPLAGDLEALHKQKGSPEPKRTPQGMLVSLPAGKPLDGNLPYRMEQGGRLVEIDLGYTPAGDDLLKKLENLPDLETLNLSGTKITDAGLELLAKLPELKKLIIEGTQVTAEAADNFRDARPMCEVFGP
jgi:hypothetical protein